MDRKEEALTLFDAGYNCAQSVLSVFCEELGATKEICLNAATAFGGGICRRSELCGAVSGALMAIGLKYGKAADPMSKNHIYNRCDDFMTQFTEANGSVICRELLGCDISTPEGMQTAREQQLFRTKCRDLVSSSVELLNSKISH